MARHNPGPDGASMHVEATPASPMPHEQEPAPHRRSQAPEEPFDRLFLAEYGKVVAVANRVLADRAEAEDVAQEVFWDFHRKQRATASYASGWLYRAAVHTALNRIRSRRRRQRRELAEVSGQEPREVDPQQVVEVEDERRRVRDALARLPVKSASVLALRYSGLSYVEVGSALGVGAGQVGTLLRRAEQALRKEMTRATPE
jgi:RNA polymerase sigma factor (sigma-70 family)